MKNPNTVPELLQSFQSNFKNFKIFKHALFVNYALIPRIITWLGLITYFAGVLSFGLFALSIHMSIMPLFHVWLYQIIPMLLIPLSFTPGSIVYWCLTVWELATIYEVIEKIIREVGIRNLFRQVQKNSRLLQIGYAYELNPHENLILKQDPKTGSWTDTLAALPVDVQNQWEHISHIQEGKFGFQRATNYNAHAIQNFLKKRFPYKFTFLDVLPSIGALPFYWQTTDTPSEKIVFYFKNNDHKASYVLNNFTPDGHKIRKTLKQILIENLLIFIWW